MLDRAITQAVDHAAMAVEYRPGVNVIEHSPLPYLDGEESS
jgi:hypothetical protein